MSYTSGTESNYYEVYGNLGANPSFVYARNIRGYPLFTAPTASLSASGDIYVIFTNVLNGGLTEFPSATEDKLYKFETIAARASTTRGGSADSATLVGADTFPLTTLSMSCPYSGTVKAAYANDAKLVLKWVFTN